MDLAGVNEDVSIMHTH